ncbi:N-acetyltransferase family protein [Nocardioides sp. CPCC 205120]|uniref:GNAT family N-acetyltransferase n=1 Tax=Nocardioides sp. CPCC 205120 TaxID=3406462 RepID=UPI003B50A05A
MTLPADVRLRRATPADAEAGARLHATCWDEGYRGVIADEHLDRVLARHPQRVELWEQLVAQGVHLAVRRDAAAEELLGFAVAGPARDPDAPTERELGAIYVRRAAWGTGVADALLTAALGDEPACLWVLADNPRAHRFYARHGFVPDGTSTHDESIDALEVRLVRA